jgi:hypothetical protein
MYGLSVSWIMLYVVRNNTGALCRPVQISDKPISYIWEDFISAEEAVHIVKAAAPRMKRSLVSSKDKVDPVRSPILCGWCML